MARHLQFEQLFAPRCRSSPSAVNAPLWFHPCPDAVYGFPHARLVERVESRYQTIEIWDTPQLGALFTLDGRPMTSAGDEFIYHECMVHPAALAHPGPRAALVLGGGDGGAARHRFVASLRTSPARGAILGSAIGAR